jgi:hypothetical protein
MKRTRGVRVVRLVWGMGLIVRTRAILRTCEADSRYGVTAALARLLGAREIGQALLLERRGGFRRSGAAIEGLHGASMLWAATRFPAQRRCALGAAVVSALLLSAELAT